MSFMTNEGSIYVYLWHYTVANMHWPLSIYNKAPFVKYVAQNISKRQKMKYQHDINVRHLNESCTCLYIKGNLEHEIFQIFKQGYYIII